MDTATGQSRWDTLLQAVMEAKQYFEYWREPTVLKTTGLRRSTMRQMVKDGQFPPPLKLSDRASGWVSTLVQEWQRECIAQHQRAASGPSMQTAPMPAAPAARPERAGSSRRRR